jgi:hypothetical protein
MQPISRDAGLIAGVASACITCIAKENYSPDQMFFVLGPKTMEKS